MLVAECPGKNEFEEKVPFVGRSGKLLNEILNECNIVRNELYISNVVKCWSHEGGRNLTPHPTCIVECGNFLCKEIELLQPKLIVTIGKSSTEYMLQENIKMTESHGQVYEWTGFGIQSYLIPVYHPSFVLRNGCTSNMVSSTNIRLKEFREDIKKISELISTLED